MKHNSIITVMIAVAAAALPGTGCKKQAPQPNGIHQYYQVQYFPGENKTIAAGYFNYLDRNGKRVTFDDRNAVRANGDTSVVYSTLNDEQLFGWDLVGTPDVVFTMPGKNGGTCTNTVNRAMMGEMELHIDSVLYVADSMRASWTGTPLLAQGESIAIVLNRLYDSTNNVYSSLRDEFFGPNSDGHSTTFNYAESSKLVPGRYNVGLAKVRTVPLQQRDGNSGGYMQVGISVFKTVEVR